MSITSSLRGYANIMVNENAPLAERIAAFKLFLKADRLVWLYKMQVAMMNPKCKNSVKDKKSLQKEFVVTMFIYRDVISFFSKKLSEGQNSKEFVPLLHHLIYSFHVCFMMEYPGDKTLLEQFQEAEEFLS